MKPVLQPTRTTKCSQAKGTQRAEEGSPIEPKPSLSLGSIAAKAMSTKKHLCLPLLAAFAVVLYPSPAETFVTSRPKPSGAIFPLSRNRILLSKRNTDENSSHKRNNKSGKRPHRRSRPYRESDLLKLDRSTQYLLNQDHSSIDPTAVTLHIEQWSQYRKQDPRVPWKIEELLQILVRMQTDATSPYVNCLDIKQYNTLLDAWACAALFRTAPDPTFAAQRAVEVLRMMQAQYEEYDHHGNHRHQQTIQPDSWSFSTVLHVVCRIEGCLVARRVLAWMEMLSDSGRNPLARPSKHSYWQVLDSYMRYNGTRRAPLIEGFIAHAGHRSLQDEHLKLPDTLSYNIAIKAWCDERKKGLPGRQVAEHADRILDIMKSDTTGLCKPDVVTYSSEF